MRVLGVNAIFHDPAAALVIDGQTVAAAEEERFSRRKHGKRPVPFSAWELPEQAAAWCLRSAGIAASDLDAVAYSFDPALARPAATVGAKDRAALHARNASVTSSRLGAEKLDRSTAARMPGPEPRSKECAWSTSR